MAKKPEWRRILGSYGTYVESWSFSWVAFIVFFVVWVLDVLRVLDLPTEFYLGLLLALLVLHATAERTAREELWEQLKAPRAFFLKDREAVYRAATELLQKAQERGTNTSIILTDLRVSRWPSEGKFPDSPETRLLFPRIHADTSRRKDRSSAPVQPPG